MRWMKLEPIIQSEVSQKEKHQYSISSVKLLSRVQLLVTPWIAARQASPSITNSRSLPNPLHHLGTHVCRVSDGHPATSSSVVPFSSCPQSLPTSESFPMSQLFAWGGQSTGVSALASFLPNKPRTDFLKNGLVGSPCRPRDSQESSPTPQFKSINSSALSLLHRPTLTSIHDHRKNHSQCIYMEFRKIVMITLYARQQKRHRCIEQSFGLCGRRWGWDDWENRIETCMLSYVKQIASPGSMHGTGCSGLVHWADPEWWDGEGGGRGVQDGEHM